MNATLEWQSPSPSTTLGKLNITNKTLLIPDMNRIGSRLFAATVRSFGIPAIILETYKANR